MAEFLLELFSEEIPARMQAKGADDLRDLIVKGLEEKGLGFTKAEAHSTPRRITVVVDGLPMENNPPPIDKKGPRVDAAQQPEAFWGAYSASKAALEKLVACYAAEMTNSSVRAACINPASVA